MKKFKVVTDTNDNYVFINASYFDVPYQTGCLMFYDVENDNIIAGFNKNGWVKVEEVVPG